MIHKGVIILACIFALLFIVLFIAGFFSEHKTVVGLDSEAITFLMTHREGIKKFECSTQPIVNEKNPKYICIIIYDGSGKYD